MSSSGRQNKRSKDLGSAIVSAVVSAIVSFAIFGLSLCHEQYVTRKARLDELGEAEEDLIESNKDLRSLLDNDSKKVCLNIGTISRQFANALYARDLKSPEAAAGSVSEYFDLSLSTPESLKFPISYYTDAVNEKVAGNNFLVTDLQIANLHVTSFSESYQTSAKRFKEAARKVQYIDSQLGQQARLSWKNLSDLQINKRADQISNGLRDGTYFDLCGVSPVFNFHLLYGKYQTCSVWSYLGGRPDGWDCAKLEKDHPENWNPSKPFAAIRGYLLPSHTGSADRAKK